MFMGLRVEEDHHPPSVVGSQSTIVIAILYIYFTLCLIFAYCQYLVIEFVVCLPYGPMYLLLQVSTQTSIARSSGVGRYGKRIGAGKGTGSGFGVGSL